MKVIKHETNKGISEARNSGLKAVTGDCFFLIDGDDYLSSSDALYSLAIHFSPDTDWVQGSYIKADERGQQVGNVSFEDATYENYDDICKNFAAMNFIYTHNKLINSKHKIRLFDTGCYHEDRMWNASVFTGLSRIITVNKPSYVYVIRQGQTSNQSRSKRLYIDSSVKLLEIMADCPQCWNTVRDTFQIVDIEKPLYLWEKDPNYRKSIINRCQKLNRVSISITGFPRATKMIHMMIENRIPDIVINTIAKSYAWIMRKLNHQI